MPTWLIVFIACSIALAVLSGIGLIWEKNKSSKK